MRGFIGSRLFQALVAFGMVVAAIVGALWGHALPSFAQSSATFTVTFTPGACGSPLTIISLNKGDKVSGTAELKGSDSGAVSGAEKLVLQETNGSFAQTVALNADAQPFSLTAAADNDSLTACVAGGAGSNLTATVSLNELSIKNFSLFSSPYFRFILGLR
jgi:hypothetical protein